MFCGPTLSDEKSLDSAMLLSGKGIVHELCIEPLSEIQTLSQHSITTSTLTVQAIQLGLIVNYRVLLSELVSIALNP